LLTGPDRGGWPPHPQVADFAHTLAILEFVGLTGVYDFTDGQWFNPLRPRHLIVRGSHGEIVDDQVTWGSSDGRPISTAIVRRQSGLDGNLEGWDLETLTWGDRVLYRNPYRGARMSDEEIAIATCLEATANWRRGNGKAPYPLAEACQDHLLSLCVHDAIHRARPVTTAVERWAVDVAVGGGDSK